MARLFNRLRILLNITLTASTALDLAFQSHPDSTLFYLDQEMPYQLLSGKEITPRQLLPFVNRLGNLLKTAGMKRYDRVAIFKSNSLDYFFYGLAIIKAGGICVPINSGMNTEQIAYYLNYTGCKMIITDQKIFEQKLKNSTLFNMIEAWLFPILSKNLNINGIDINAEVQNCSEILDPVHLHKDSVVLIVHTSGTTGFPKGVISTSGSIIAGVKGHFFCEPVSTRNRIGVAGFYNHLVYYIGFFTSMLGNFSTFAISHPEPEDALKMIERHRINIFFAFPDVYMKMYLAGLNRYNLDSVKIWIATADSSHEVHMEAFCKYGSFLKLLQKRMICSIFIDVIGTSEVGSGAIRRIYLPFFKLKYKRLVGWPVLGGVSVKVADEFGRRLPSGNPGHLMVKGATLFKGYWNAHDMLNGVVIDGWWWTGDIGYRDWCGRFYHLDRETDMIHTQSGTVYTLLLEEILLSHPQVGEVAVIGVPINDREKAPVAIIEPKLGSIIDADDFLSWANTKLEQGISLHKVVVVEPNDIPRGLTGKVLKRMLREQYATILINPGTFSLFSN